MVNAQRPRVQGYYSRMRGVLRVTFVVAIVIGCGAAQPASPPPPPSPPIAAYTPAHPDAGPPPRAPLILPHGDPAAPWDLVLPGDLWDVTIGAGGVSDGNVELVIGAGNVGARTYEVLEDGALRAMDEGE